MWLIKDGVSFTLLGLDLDSLHGHLRERLLTWCDENADRKNGLQKG